MVYYLELGDYCRIAGEVLGLDPERVAELPNIGLADSALAMPRAAFGDHEAFPTLVEKAAILVERLARNHPLPDGNKRCAFLALERFLAVNGRPILGSDPERATGLALDHRSRMTCSRGHKIGNSASRTTELPLVPKRGIEVD